MLAVGIKTERDPTSAAERALGLRPIRDDLIDCDQIPQTVRQYVYPEPRGLECTPWPMEQSKSVLTIFVPRQDSDDKPFISREDGTTRANR